MSSERINTGHAALAVDSGDVPSQESTIVHGIAIGEGDITVGGSGKETFWPKSTLKEAAAALEGQPLATDVDHTADDPNPQTPVEAIAGEVTWAGYEPGVGVLYEAEVDDEDLAKKIQKGRLEVSPLVSRELEPLENDKADFKATKINGWRDLALVANGAAPSNKIEVGQNPMQAEALHEKIEALRDETNGMSQEALQRDTAREPTFDGTETSEEQSWGDVSKNFGDWIDALDIEAENVDELSESQKETIAQHTLLGDANADTWGELSFFPVVNPNTSNLNEGALNAVRGGRGASADIPEDTYSSAEGMAESLLADEFEGYEMQDGELVSDASMSEHGDEESMSEETEETDESDTESMESNTMGDDGAEEDKPQSTVAADSEEDAITMEDLTDTDKAVLEAAESLDEPIEALEEYAATEQPTIVEQDTFESMRGVLEDALSERTDLKESTIEALSFSALVDEFRDEEGELKAEALIQEPETSDPPADESGKEALGEDADVDKAEALYEDYQTFENELLKDDIVEVLGVDDWDTATEVLN